MNGERRTILTFPSTHHAIAAQEKLQHGHVPFIVIPTPVEISSNCGIALSVASADTAIARHMLMESGIPKNDTTFTKARIIGGKLIVLLLSVDGE
ncbi:MAG TPA: hypothetical protein DEZ27_10415 [Sphaerochaeta sp.]|nr:hypothetical protein [Sphaerochaeta sp.]